jgi:hypothetical protein
LGLRLGDGDEDGCQEKLRDLRILLDHFHPQFNVKGTQSGRFQDEKPNST